MARVEINYDAQLHTLIAKAIRERDVELINDIEIEVIGQMMMPEETDAKLDLLAAATEIIEATL